MTMGEEWHYQQVCPSPNLLKSHNMIQFIKACLANGTTILGIIIVSDRTHLTNFTGDKKMHTVYLSIGNISKDVRQKHNSCAWLLVSKIPISKFLKTQFSGPKTKQEAMPGILSHRLFHECMQQVLAPLRLDQRQYYVVPSPDGNSRLCMAVLMAWIADLEEQLLILGVQNLSCPVCTAVYHNLAENDGCGVCTGEATISALKEVQRRFPSASLYEFKQQVKRLSKGLSGTIEEPCWAGLGIDPSVFIKQDILHGLHKFIWDHPGKWLKKLIGENEIDHHFIVQPPIHTQRFTGGISKISQASRQEHRTYQRLMLPIIFGHEKVDAKVIDPLCSSLSFVYFPHYPFLSDPTLSKMKYLLSSFNRNKEVFISNGS